jgi:mannitol/fructose-specific phosphotransferase system IIA component (Ntr-type)
MSLQEYLKPDAIVRLHGTSKQQVLDELIDYAAGHADISRDRLASAVWEREEMMSTGICRGIAIPHVRIKELSRLHLFIGVCDHPIADYECMDNAPVRVLVFIGAPSGQQKAYLQLLARISQKLKAGDTLERLTAPNITAKEIHAIMATSWAKGV